MRKKLSFLKVKVISSLIVVIALVFVTNRIDKKHFTQVQDTINTLFYDRVMAQDHLFKMDRILQEQAVLLEISRSEQIDSQTWNTASNDFEELIRLYEGTKLTKREEATLGKLKSNFSDFRSHDQNILSDSDDESIKSSQRELEHIRENITALAEIQVSESKNLKLQAQKSLQANEFMSNVEIISLVGLGILFQLTIFFLGRNKDLKTEE